MIPETKQAAVKNALQAAFGVSEFEDIQLLTAGLSSALIFRITVKGKLYLLRVISRTDTMGDPAHYYACMKPAAEAGIAPHIWYAGTADRISITDFVDAKPFCINEARAKLPDVLRRLHSLPPFAFRVNYLDTMDGFVRKFLAANILPGSITGDVLHQYERIKTVYPHKTGDLVACHNDLKPDNILFDGDRVWLVDWEAAFLNDRYVDMAVVANFVVTNDEEENEYLNVYFSPAANEYQRARFFLARQLMHMIYSAFFLLHAGVATPLDLNVATPGFRELHDELWLGKIDLVDNDAKKIYAIVHLQQLLHNIALERFEESLTVVSNNQTN